MPSQVFATLYRAFEQVPQQILWKCAKGENTPAPAGNVKCIERCATTPPHCVRIAFFLSSFFFVFRRAGLNVERSLYAKVTEGGSPSQCTSRASRGEILDNGVDVGRLGAADDWGMFLNVPTSYRARARSRARNMCEIWWYISSNEVL